MNYRLLQKGNAIPAREVVNFRFNGKPYQGYRGDTLASALLASGVSVVARSWKYHRVRGIVSAGSEEPSAMVQLYSGAHAIPNAKATEVELVEGLEAHAIHAWPSLGFDLRVLNQVFARVIPAGFYYKTFMASQKLWHFFEKYIRAASGLGEAPQEADASIYSKRFDHCDVLVIGAGAAGMMAALASATAGLRVIVVDAQNELGGWLTTSTTTLDQLSAIDWVRRTAAQLQSMPNVRVLVRTSATAYYSDNFVVLVERKGDHLPLSQQNGARECLWKVRAKRVILATGAIERPLVFCNNDLPNIMLASAVSSYIERYAVLAWRTAVIFTNNDLAYETALTLKQVNAHVTIVDARETINPTLKQLCTQWGIEVCLAHVVIEACGSHKVNSVVVQGIDTESKLINTARTLPCDLLAVSGGFSPLIHLFCQNGEKPQFDENLLAFVPAAAMENENTRITAGACKGVFGIANALKDGANKGALVAGQLLGKACAALPLPVVKHPDQLPDLCLSQCKPRALWICPHIKPISRAPKQFVDLQNDVTAADLALALREGFESIEHVKRYTALGFGTDQGKTSHVNAIGIVAQLLNKPLAAVSTTTFRPNYTPVTFGSYAATELGELFEPVRKTAMHAWHVAAGAKFEDVGQWKRPWYYPSEGEDIHSAVNREVLAARNSVAMLDASTLGKIDIQGEDATKLLNWVYTNAWSKLAIGRCRYGLMLDENGMVFDDGVTVRLGEHHYLMHTTSGGAARVLAWLEHWLQTEWPTYKVYLTSVTDHWSTIALIGPKSQDVLAKVSTEIDLSDEAFPLMTYQEASVCGVPARIMRISFSGELSYEINIASHEALKVWEQVYAAGAEFGITPYGTETMHVLRAEKGYIIVGQETDGSVTPYDLGLGSMVSTQKDFLGKRSLTRSHTAQSRRKQLVGLLTRDPEHVLAEGAQVLHSSLGDTRPQAMAGRVTSSYYSATLQRSVAMALIENGHSRMDENVEVYDLEHGVIKATICSPVFYNPPPA